jgi:hypothetical protein
VGLIASAVLVLLAAACAGGGPSSARAGGSPSAAAATGSAIAYSACMRSHGVPNFPDPDPASGAVPKVDAQRLGVGASQLRAAQTACQPLYPNNGGSLEQQTEQCISTGNCPPALVQQVLTLERSFSACMRSHGLPHWPDPSLDSEGRPIFVISISGDLGGVDPHEPQISSKEDECGRLTGSPEPREVNP